MGEPCGALPFEGIAARRSALAALARLRAEKYFFRCTCRRRKWLKLYLRLRAQTLRGVLTFCGAFGAPSGALSLFSGNLPQGSVPRRRDFSLFAVAQRGCIVVF